MTASCLYTGHIRHRRSGPRRNDFRYRIYLAYLDLGELPTLFAGRWLWSARRPALAWFRRADYLGDPQVPLDTAVRDRVEAQTGHRPQGPIRLLTHLRQFGWSFNPVSFYYVFDDSGEHLETLVAEITNTKPRWVWNLASEKGSAPSRGFAYGDDVEGLRRVGGSAPSALVPGTAYRLEIEASGARGSVDFTPQAAAGATP